MTIFNNDLIMCKDTERLVKLLAHSENPTDMALIILANKIDNLESKIQDLNEATRFARQLDENKKTIISIVTAVIVFAAFGVSEFIEFIKAKLGL